MTRVVSACPYCATPTAFLDPSGPTLRLGGDPSRPGPCPHAVAVTVGLHFDGDDGGTPPPDAAWFWLRGGPVRPDFRHTDPVSRAVVALALGGLDPADRPRGAYRVGGGTMAERAAADPGSGSLPVTGPGGTYHGGIDGWGLYSDDPDALVAELCVLAEVSAAIG